MGFFYTPIFHPKKMNLFNIFYEILNSLKTKQPLYFTPRKLELTDSIL